MRTKSMLLYVYAFQKIFLNRKIYNFLQDQDIYIHNINID